MSFVLTQTQDQILKKNQTNKDFNQKSEMGGLSFLQSLSDLTAIPRNRVETEEIKETYIHPISSKHSVSKLSEKSLEMCTESLGTETGSESGDELSFLALEATYSPRKDTNFVTNKPKINRNNSFPPPIKFADGSKGNRIVRFNGEDGRLVVQAIRVSLRPSCLIAERSEGRLRLCLSSCEEEDEDEDEEDEEEETEEGINENNENLEGKNGNRKISRLSGRCKENGDASNKPMITWKQQFWVST